MILPPNQNPSHMKIFMSAAGGSHYTEVTVFVGSKEEQSSQPKLIRSF